ncbi:MAG: rod-binding protein [Spongiibacteraceae bacterium]
MDIKSSSYHDFSALSALRKDASESPEQAAMPVAKQFEALFLQMMLKSMRDTVPEGGLLSSNSMDSYQQMFDSQLSVDLAEGGGVGLAEVIAKQISGAPATKAVLPSVQLDSTALQLQLQQLRIQD